MPVRWPRRPAAVSEAVVADAEPVQKAHRRWGPPKWRLLINPRSAQSPFFGSSTRENTNPSQPALPASPAGPGRPKDARGASGAERTAREKKGADHRPSARRWPGYVRRGTGGASNCTNGPNYGPATAKSAQMDLARGFARWLLRDDPDTDDGIFSVRLSIPMVGLVGGSERRWVPGSGMHRKVVPLRAPTSG